MKLMPESRPVFRASELLLLPSSDSEQHGEPDPGRIVVCSHSDDRNFEAGLRKFSVFQYCRPDVQILFADKFILSILFPERRSDREISCGASNNFLLRPIHKYRKSQSIP